MPSTKRRSSGSSAVIIVSSDEEDEVRASHDNVRHCHPYSGIIRHAAALRLSGCLSPLPLPPLAGPLWTLRSSCIRSHGVVNPCSGTIGTRCDLREISGSRRLPPHHQDAMRSRARQGALRRQLGGGDQLAQVWVHVVLKVTYHAEHLIGKCLFMVAFWSTFQLGMLSVQLRPWCCTGGSAPSVS